MLAIICLWVAVGRLSAILSKKQRVAAEEENKLNSAEILRQISKRCIDCHLHQLILEKKRHTRTDPYGLTIDCGWSYSENSQSGISYFVNVVIRSEYTGPRLCNLETAINKFNSMYIENYFEWIEGLIDLKIQEELNSRSISNRLAVEEEIDVERMSGREYEQYCKSILINAGWEVNQTPTTGDQGVDLLAKMDKVIVCIQCKRYSSAVGNRAVQEVIAGRAFYGGTHAVVVSNAEFTTAAEELAASANVKLISETDLEDLEFII